MYIPKLFLSLKGIEVPIGPHNNNVPSNSTSHKPPTTLTPLLQSLTSSTPTLFPPLPANEDPTTLQETLLFSLFILFIIAATCLLVLFLILLPRAADYLEDWWEGRSKEDWRRKGGERGLLLPRCSRRRVISRYGTGVRMGYGACGFRGCTLTSTRHVQVRREVMGCMKKSTYTGAELDLERADGGGDDKNEVGGYYEGGDEYVPSVRKKGVSGKTVTFGEEVQVFEVREMRAVMCRPCDEEEKKVVRLKSGHEVD
ncbi:hypothetical protein HYALB_00002884 [Hymenoscyphus albidus]|uniref:Uncharacterized protein n=1 Tax=Hymenoscyphus albidus TaxID=595503 RepID=A0A9N9LXN2_9HELO|nr:hypothetical protein HYALB_00002884 [Hymenoscyphus albidus]